MKARRVALAGSLSLLVFCGGCHVLWPGIGAVDLPYDPGAVRELEVRRLEDFTHDPALDLQSEVEALQQGSVSDGVVPDTARGAQTRTPMPLALDVLRRRVLENNLEIEVALYDPQLAARSVSAEEAKFDAIIGSRFRYERKDTPERDSLLVQFDADSPALDDEVVKFTEIEQTKELTDLGLSVTLPLPTGGSVSLGGSLFQKDIFSPDSFEEYVAATQFSFSQPLLRDAGLAANLASIRLARADQGLSEVRTKLAAMRVLAGAEKAYWALYAARQLLDLRREQHRLATENLEIVRERVDRGLDPPVDIQRALAAVASRQESLVVADTTWRLRQRELESYLVKSGQQLGSSPFFEPSSDPFLVGLNLDKDALVERALAERPDLIALEIALVRDGILIQKRRNQALPIANLDFQYGLLDRAQSFGTAASDQFDFDNDELFVGLTVEVPLTNRRREAQLERAILQRSSRLATKQARRLHVRREVLDSIDRLERNWRRIIVARANVIAQAARYEAERDLYLGGFQSQVAVLLALTELGDAQRREVVAIADYQASQVDLAFATGTLLGYARVDLSPLVLPVAGASR